MIELIDRTKLTTSFDGHEVFYSCKDVENAPVCDLNNVSQTLESGLDEILYNRCFTQDYECGMEEVRQLLAKTLKSEGIE